MDINWFPGHMTKSLRMMDENIDLIDVLIYVLDSRAPASCINPAFNKYTQKLPVVYVLNKIDLADPVATDDWKKYLTDKNSAALCLNSTMSGSSKAINKLTTELCFDKIKKYEIKGVKAVLRAMVIGVPNSGKSTLINNLCGKTKAVTGNKAGVTRGKQWVRVTDYLEILDTPGTLYPKINDQTLAKHLAYLGSIKDEVLDVYELALELLKELYLINKKIIDNRYNIESTDDALATLEKIAVAKGLRKKGGIIDEERASLMIIDDFRKGRMGRITLDVVK